MVDSRGSHQSVGANIEAQNVKHIVCLYTLTLAFNRIGLHNGVNLGVRFNAILFFLCPEILQLSCNEMNGTQE